MMPAAVVPDADGLRDLLARHWQHNRPLRRFVLAFDRLHRELAGEKLMASEAADTERAVEASRQEAMRKELRKFMERATGRRPQGPVWAARV